MHKYKIVSTAKIETYQYVEAESEDEAMGIWEKSDTSLEEIDEEKLDDLAFKSIKQVK